MNIRLGFPPDVHRGPCELIYMADLPEYFLDTSIYNTIIEYDELFQGLQAPFTPHNTIYNVDYLDYLDWFVKDPEFAAGMQVAGFSLYRRIHVAYSNTY
jgi:hypothetical protein